MWMQSFHRVTSLYLIRVVNSFLECFRLAESLNYWATDILVFIMRWRLYFFVRAWKFCQERMSWNYSGESTIRQRRNDKSPPPSSHSQLALNTCVAVHLRLGYNVRYLSQCIIICYKGQTHQRSEVQYVLYYWSFMRVGHVSLLIW